MNFKVNEEAQFFSIAMNKGFSKRVGHGVRIGVWDFCVLPEIDGLNITEVTTGGRVLFIPIEDEIADSLQEKEDFLKHVNDFVVPYVISRLEGKEMEIEKELLQQRNRVENLHGIVPGPVSMEEGWKDVFN